MRYFGMRDIILRVILSALILISFAISSLAPFRLLIAIIIVFTIPGILVLKLLGYKSSPLKLILFSVPISILISTFISSMLLLFKTLTTSTLRFIYIPLALLTLWSPRFNLASILSKVKLLSRRRILLLSLLLASILLYISLRSLLLFKVELYAIPRRSITICFNGSFIPYIEDLAYSPIILIYSTIYALSGFISSLEVLFYLSLLPPLILALLAFYLYSLKYTSNTLASEISPLILLLAGGFGWLCLEKFSAVKGGLYRKLLPSLAHLCQASSLGDIGDTFPLRILFNFKPYILGFLLFLIASITFTERLDLKLKGLILVSSLCILSMICPVYVFLLLSHFLILSYFRRAYFSDIYLTLTGIITAIPFSLLIQFSLYKLYTTYLLPIIAVMVVFNLLVMLTTRVMFSRGLHRGGRIAWGKVLAVVKCLCVILLVLYVSSVFFWISNCHKIVYSNPNIVPLCFYPIILGLPGLAPMLAVLFDDVLKETREFLLLLLSGFILCQIPKIVYLNMHVKGGLLYFSTLLGFSELQMIFLLLYPVLCILYAHLIVRVAYRLNLKFKDTWFILFLLIFIVSISYFRTLTLSRYYRTLSYDEFTLVRSMYSRPDYIRLVSEANILTLSHKSDIIASCIPSHLTLLSFRKNILGCLRVDRLYPMIFQGSKPLIVIYSSREVSKFRNPIIQELLYTSNTILNSSGYIVSYIPVLPVNQTLSPILYVSDNGFNIWNIALSTLLSRLKLNYSMASIRNFEGKVNCSLAVIMAKPSILFHIASEKKMLSRLYSKKIIVLNKGPLNWRLVTPILKPNLLIVSLTPLDTRYIVVNGVKYNGSIVLSLPVKPLKLNIRCRGVRENSLIIYGRGRNVLLKSFGEVKGKRSILITLVFDKPISLTKYRYIVLGFDKPVNKTISVKGQLAIQLANGSMSFNIGNTVKCPGEIWLKIEVEDYMKRLYLYVEGNSTFKISYIALTIEPKVLISISTRERIALALNIITPNGRTVKVKAPSNMTLNCTSITLTIFQQPLNVTLSALEEDTYQILNGGVLIFETCFKGLNLTYINVNKSLLQPEVLRSLMNALNSSLGNYRVRYVRYDVKVKYPIVRSMVLKHVGLRFKGRINYSSFMISLIALSITMLIIVWLRSFKSGVIARSITAYLYENPHSTPTLLFMIFLVASAIFLSLGKESIANKLAEYAYYLLVIAVILALLGLRRGERSE